MRLSSIRFENFRQLPDFELEVRENLVLVGPNDSGKTSILFGLHLLLGTSNQQLIASLTPADFTDPNQELLIEATLVGFSDQECAAFPDEIETEGHEHLRFRLEASVRENDSTECDVRRRFLDSGYPRGPSHDQLAAFGWEYVPATRSLQRELGGSQTGVVRSLMARIDLGLDLGAIRSALAELADLVDGATAVVEFRRELAEALSSTLPREIATDSIKVVVPGSLSDTPLSDAQVGIDEGGTTRPLNQQSDGVRALAALAAYGIAHFGANIVAIDEPEMHLHPSAQKLVASLLVNSAPQSLLATHSSHVAAGVDPLHIVVVHKDRPPAQLPAGTNAATFEFARRWWQDSFLQPLTARCVIAVEGPTDRILMEATAKVLDVRLHRFGIHVFDLGSADQFANAYGVFGQAGFGVRLLGLVDEDHRHQWATVVGVAGQDLESAGYRVSDPDLEGELVRVLGVERLVELLVGDSTAERGALLARFSAASPSAIDSGRMAEFLRSTKTKSVTAIAKRIERRDAEALVKISELLTLASR